MLRSTAPVRMDSMVAGIACARSPHLKPSTTQRAGDATLKSLDGYRWFDRSLTRVKPNRPPGWVPPRRGPVKAPFSNEIKGGRAPTPNMYPEPAKTRDDGV